MRKNMRELKKNSGNPNEDQGSKSIDFNTSDRQSFAMQINFQDGDLQDESDNKKKKGKAN